MASFHKLQQALTQNIHNKNTTQNPSNVPQSKEITEPSMKECFEKACLLFQKTLDELNYEVLQKGSRGFLGLGKKSYTIRFTPKQVLGVFAHSPAQISQQSSQSTLSTAPQTITKDENGRAQFAMKRNGAFFRVIAPQGDGKPVTFKQCIALLEARGLQSYENAKIQSILDKSSGEWVRIGEYISYPNLDSKVHVSVSSNKLKAYITISPPTLLGRTLEVSDIVHALKEAGVIHGINTDLIQEALDLELYKQSILIAQGEEAQHGNNATIDFRFDPTTESIKIHAGVSDKVDFFSDLGVIQNAKQGQILAEKIPLTQGKDGILLTGELIPTKEGRDIDLQVGKNVKLSDDGMQAIATCEGRISYHNNIIAIEEIYEIDGNISLETGSITFTGDVRINGNIEDGFAVNTQGNIYVGGTIGKCKVSTDGDILVQGGIVGKDEAEIRSGGNIIAKFIQSASVIAKNTIIAPEGILHSQVQGKRVYALGKRGTINGGHIQALEEINAKFLGTTSYNETKLEVGYDAETSKKLQSLEKEQEEITENLKQVDAELFKVHQNTFIKNKQEATEPLKKVKKDMNSHLEKVVQEIQALKNYSIDIAIKGIIAGQEKIYPGCEIIIRNSILKVKQEYVFTSFRIQDKDFGIQTTEYRESREALPSLEQKAPKAKGKTTKSRRKTSTTS